MRSSICVTGASGLVGHALVAELTKSGNFEVLALTRNLFSNSVAEATYRAVGDIGSVTQLDAELVGIHTLVHCAARVHVMQDMEVDSLAAFRAVNVVGTLNLARLAASKGVMRFLFLSSVKVNGESTQPGVAFTEVDMSAPQDAYGVSKQEAERGLRQIAAETGMEVVIIRPPLVYGPGVKANFAALMHAVQKGWPLPLGAIHNRRSLVALDNLVDFIITCISHPKAANQTFLISDGQDLSTAELVQGLAQAAGVPARLLPVPMWALEWAGRLVGKGDAVQRLCGNLQIDSSKANNLLGWKPKIPVQEGLRRAVSGGTLL
jgi:UDP-glucose 4-epimerase